MFLDIYVYFVYYIGSYLIRKGCHKMNYEKSNGSFLKDRIYDYVTVNVQNGIFLPNSKISEESIATALEVSRTPVREVLTQLASEGFIEKIPHRGFFVKEWSKQEKIESYEVIGFLDFMCARKAFSCLLEEDFIKMSEYIAKMDVAIQFKNYSDYVENQSKFHYTYIQKCNNTILIKTIYSLLSSPMPVTYSSTQADDELYTLLDSVNQEHKDILKAMQKKDLQSLEKLIFDHWNVFKVEYV